MYSLVLMAALSTAPEVPSGCCLFGGCCKAYSCCGCYGGGYYGGCYGGGCYGGGCYGGGCYGGGCYGCSGCMGCWGSAAPMMVVPPAAAPAPAPTPVPKGGAAEPAKGAAAFYQGKVVVEVPENARLYVDDHLVKTAPGTRTFNTPVLQPGQSYFYMFRVEIDVNGKTQKDTKQVIVRAGQSSQVAFPELIARTKQPAPSAASAQ